MSTPAPDGEALAYKVRVAFAEGRQADCFVEHLVADAERLLGKAAAHG